MLIVVRDQLVRDDSGVREVLDVLDDFVLFHGFLDFVGFDQSSMECMIPGIAFLTRVRCWWIELLDRPNWLASS